MPRRAEKGTGKTRLTPDPEAFAAAKRPAVYAIADALLGQWLALQQHFGLRAEAFQVFLLVAIATAQPLSRSGRVPDGLGDATPLPRDLVGSLSRRRIAELLGIPNETVRRHAADLLAAGLLVELGRGRLATRGGTLRRLDEAGLDDLLLLRSVKVANTLIDLGAARLVR